MDSPCKCKQTPTLFPTPAHQEGGGGDWQRNDGTQGSNGARLGLGMQVWSAGTWKRPWNAGEGCGDTAGTWNTGEGDSHDKLSQVTPLLHFHFVHSGSKSIPAASQQVQHAGLITAPCENAATCRVQWNNTSQLSERIDPTTCCDMEGNGCLK